MKDEQELLNVLSRIHDEIVAQGQILISMTSLLAVGVARQEKIAGDKLGAAKVMAVAEAISRKPMPDFISTEEP